MKNTSAYFFLFLSLVISCSPEKPKTTSDPYYRSEFMVRADRDTVIFGKQGTKIEISKNSFLDDFDSLSSYKIILDEFYEISDILIGGLSTTTKDSILSTSGMIFIDALEVNGRLLLRDSSLLRITFRGNSSNNLRYLPFFGEWLNDGSQSTLVWRRSDSISIDPRFIKREINNDIFIIRDTSSSFFTSRKLGWINSDMFISIQYKKDIFVLSKESINYEAFAILKNVNSVIKGKMTENGNFFFPSIPIEYEVFIAAVASMPPYRYDIQKVNQKDTIFIKLKEGTIQQFKDEIDEILSSG